MRQKQIKESKELIMRGFFSLLNEKEYSKISMTEIAEVSMVTRMTLYRHFKNKEDIVKFLITDLVQSIQTKFSKMEQKSIATIIYVRNIEIYNNEYLKIAISNKDIESLIREVKISSRKMLSEYFGVYNINDDYLYSFIVGGIEAITTKWILGGMKESPDVITKETIRILKLMNVSMEVNI